MARHYIRAVTGLGQLLEIPAPSIDMTSNISHFGVAGAYTSGGGYVRKSRFGAQTLGVSWNDLNTDDTNRLRQISEWGMFYFDNPMSHQNVALPWLANHTYVDNVTPNAYGFSNRTYTLTGFNRISEPQTDALGGAYIGYPSVHCTRYEVGPSTGTTSLYPIIIPHGYMARSWFVGETTGSVSLSLGGYSIPVNTPTTYGTEYPTNYRDIVIGSGILPSLAVTGAGTLTLQSIQIRILPVGAPEEPLTYSPGLGNSGVEFTEEGLQLVQHSAALDLQTAAATWMETGWWK